MTVKLLFSCLYRAIILGLLVSCETTIEVDIPQYPAQLTANSLFTPDSVWQVELTQNRSVLEVAPFASVTNAEVQVAGPDGTSISLTYQGDNPYTGNSIYRAAGERPLLNTSYTLSVTHPTLGNLTANGQINNPPTPLLNVVWDTTDTRQDTTIPADEVAYGVTVALDDPPEENFYSLSIIAREILVDERDFDQDDNPEYVVISRAERFVGLQSDDPIVDNPFQGSRSELLFKDVSFNGQQYVLKLYMNQVLSTSNYRYLDLFVPFGPWAFPYDYDVYDEEGNFLYPKGSPAYSYRLYVVLRTVTEDYYQYNYTRDLQASVENNPFAQPVQLYDNIDGGLGIFAGYSQTEYNFLIP